MDEPGEKRALLRTFGELLDGDRGRCDLVEYVRAKLALVESLQELRVAAKRWAGALETEQGWQAAGILGPAAEWRNVSRGMRARLWGAAAIVVDGVALLVHSAFGSDPLSPDEATCGLNQDEADIVVLLHRRAAAIIARRKIDRKKRG